VRRARHRRRAHALYRVEQVGNDARTKRADGLFFGQASATLGTAAARQFVAITDPGSQLQKTAEAKGFRRVFRGVPNIGGRYSVLSHFGMVPLAATGHDPRVFLETAGATARGCGPEIPPAENHGVVALGLAIGVLAVAGHDKLTIIASPSIGSFGAWAEQLLAESTAKT
jgi:transaldolase/glucose-6-phosphate isomerase